MPGVAIGKNLGLGYAGTPTRQDDNLIRNRISSDAGNIVYGAPVILASDNTYKNWATDSTAAIFAGVAVANVKTNQTYGTGMNNSGYYAPKQPVDVLERGSILVFCKSGTPTAGGAVYIRTVVDGSKAIGDFEATADAGKNVIIANAKWTTGKIDSSLIAEVTLLTRTTP
jgi:hypothetical protein